MRRIAWQTLTWLFVALGIVGAVLPLLPTTPFLLVAAWAAPKASPELGHWLENHPSLGPFLSSWREHRSLSVRVKLLAVLALALAWGLLVWRGHDTVVLAVAGTFFLGIGGWLTTRPTAKGE